MDQNAIQTHITDSVTELEASEDVRKIVADNDFMGDLDKMKIPKICGRNTPKVRREKRRMWRTVLDDELNEESMLLLGVTLVVAIFYLAYLGDTDDSLTKILCVTMAVTMAVTAALTMIGERCGYRSIDASSTQTENYQKLRKLSTKPNGTHLTAVTQKYGQLLWVAEQAQKRKSILNEGIVVASIINQDVENLEKQRKACETVIIAVNSYSYSLKARIATLETLFAYEHSDLTVGLNDIGKLASGLMDEMDELLKVEGA